MKNLLLSLLLLMTTSYTASAQEGAWKIEKAQLPNGKPYEGALSISKIGNTYDVDWKTSAGNYSGIGLLVNGKLFVGYGINSAYGIVVYQASPAQQRLQGVWTTSKLNGKTGTEIIVGKNGQYDVEGKNADGTPYRGKLMMQKTGDTFQAQWTIAGQTYNGVGFMSGDMLVIGYGFGQAFGTVEYLIIGNKAKGRWAMGGGSQLGTENLTR